MKVFVGYGYNDRDTWIEDWVFPLIRSFDFEIESGKGLEGLGLSEEVRARIGKSRAVIGFTTRRVQQVNDYWSTHRWVVDELTHAGNLGLRHMEVRESGVDPQEGMRNGLGRLDFDFERKEVLLVELAAVLQRWRRELQSIQVWLLPEAIRPMIMRSYRDQGFKCVYRTMIEAEESDPVEVRPVPYKGGVYIKLRDVPLNAAVQVEICCDGKTFRSDFEPIDAPTLTLLGDH